jgi:hypothetical protein
MNSFLPVALLAGNIVEAERTLTCAFYGRH